LEWQLQKFNLEWHTASLLVADEFYSNGRLQTNSDYAVAKLETRLLLGMGLTSEAVAKQFNISRVDQDEFAFQSHKRP
jgi:acetyl-CoA acyltransferase